MPTSGLRHVAHRILEQGRVVERDEGAADDRTILHERAHVRDVAQDFREVLFGVRRRAAFGAFSRS